MKTCQLFCAGVLSLSAAAAGAQEATQFPLEPSTFTRAEVKAEFLRARAAGEIAYGEAEWRSARAPVRSEGAAPAARSREDVRREARLAVRDSRFDHLNAGG